MSINLNSIFEQTLAGIFVVIISWLMSLIVSANSRQLSKSLWGWVQFQWRIVIILLYVASVTIVVHIIYSNWNTTIIVLGSIGFAWVISLLINRSRSESVIFYDFRRPLQNWQPTKNQIPELDLIKGTKIEPHINLSKYIRLSLTIRLRVTSYQEISCFASANALQNTSFANFFG